MAFCAAIATAVVVGACGGGLPGNDVAQVGSAPISMAAFNHWMVVANDANQASTGVRAPFLPDPPNYTGCIASSRSTPATSSNSASVLKGLCQARYQSLTTAVMNYLVQALWVEGEGRAHGVNVTQAQVDKAFQARRKASVPSLATNAQLNHFLANSGETVGDMKWQTYLNLVAVAIQTKLLKQASHVTKAQIAAYYNKNRAKFVTPTKLDMHVIETSGLSTANHVVALLETGGTYATLAPKYSTDLTTKSVGGKLTGVIAGQLPAQLSVQAFAAKVGRVSGPVKTPFGYYVFTVDKITPGVTQTLAQASAAAKSQIIGQQQTAAGNSLNNDFLKVWEPRTVCRSGYAVAPSCSNAPKTTTSATTAPTGSTVVGG
jgi:foldase protein PrsA